MTPAGRDPHSFFDPAQPRLQRLDWDVRVDFTTQRLHATARLGFDRDGDVDLDTRGLEILSVQGDDGAALAFELGDDTPILGRRLRVTLAPGTTHATIAYRTAAGASGLQWLDAEQTHGRRQPFLFSQCQAIHARSVVPLQDTPRVRFPYAATLHIPAALSAVMSAAPATTPDTALTAPTGATMRSVHFVMPQPVPPYLIALAVGELESRDLSPRSRVWAEPGVVAEAAWEFAEVEHLLATAERLFGPYDWDRYDMLVLPPSFPYGGMENPRMTFLTPTLLAGDRSLVDVVAHELAHSWTGNLVTNADAEHFWLNEGWTVWAERRILEALHGPDAAARSWALGAHSLAGSLQRFGPDSPLTRLRTQLTGVDPDEAYSTIPYEKGALFLSALERAAGRERFDVFVRAYMDRHRFGSITTEEFLAFVEAELPGIAARVDADAWVYATGVPADAPRFHSPELDAIDAAVAAWKTGERPERAATRQWSPIDVQLFLQRLPRPLDAAGCEWLDTMLALATQRNAEVTCEWLAIAAASDYEPAFERIREFLVAFGRMKYLRPLYGALAATSRTRALAHATFAVAAPRYHALARRMVQGILAAYPR